MYANLRKIAFVTAAVMCTTTISIAPAFAATAMQDRDHRDNRDQVQQNRDYSNNSYYQLGNREGLQDRKRNKQRKEHNHKFRNDEDRQAHDNGYSNGWGNEHSEHQEHPR